MSRSIIEADYLVVGGGAMGMAFTDTLLTETDATVVMIDRNSAPGGHWNVAYPYVRLHQPSAFYGVNSMPLGSDAIDTAGLNKGLYELATGSEVCTYFQQVMQRRFLPSGRMQYFPMSEYLGGRRFSSLLSGDEFAVEATKVVDATYMNVKVPAMGRPSYAVADGVNCVPVNGLGLTRNPVDQYVIIGAGKTGIDACLFLLQHDVDPDRIIWIMPRDAWLLDRATIQAGELFEDSIGSSFGKMFAAIEGAESIDDLFMRVSDCGQLLRFDESVRPTMYRCGTVTRAELALLRGIKNVVRQGRVQSIEKDRVILDDGSINTGPSVLHVDCTADGLAKRPVVRVFDQDKITLQSVRTCQQVFSAAMIGFVESNYAADDIKNEICTPVPHPNSDTDYLRTLLADLINGARWMQEEALQGWLKNARLDALTQAETSREIDMARAQSVADSAGRAAEKITALLADES